MRQFVQHIFYRWFVGGGLIGVGISLFFFMIFANYKLDNLLVNLMVNTFLGFLAGGLISLFSSLMIFLVQKLLNNHSRLIFFIPFSNFIIGFSIFYLLGSLFNRFFDVMPSEIQLGISLGVGIISTLITLFYMFLEQQQQRIQLEKENRRLAVAEERNRIARELHDSVSQNLFGISLNLTTLPGILKDDPDKALVIINQLQNMVQEIQTEMRLMIYELGPVGLQSRGFLEALENLVVLFRKRYNVDISFNFAGEEEKLSNKIQLVLYRVLQESLNNAIKHSGVDKIQVSLNIKADGVEMIVSDQGKGFKLEQVDGSSHFGITGMKERVEGVGGELYIRSDYGKGTDVRVMISYN